ncbi:MAG: hypothetical protein AB7N80_02620 [Bdellovibrionales bacterium]
MDRRLLTFAILTFTLELLLFLGDVGVLPVHWLSRSTVSHDRAAIGEVQIARQNVRRRGFDSNIWEDSATRDRLFENDSILTLSGSTAKLKLQGDVNIELHENTLVVLESLDEQIDKPFRLRFSRGDLRAQNPARGVQLKSGDWAITATPGADLSLRAVDSGRVEVEVNSGEVDVQHAVHGLKRKVTSEQRVMLYPEEASEVVTTSQDLKWQDGKEQKIYAHQFPIHAKFEWVGQADTLQVLSPTHGAKAWPVKSQQSSADLEFVPGSYHLTLAYKDKISKTLSIQVLKAPKIVHLTPLPRDRVKTDHPTLFGWLSEMQVGSYKLELARDANFNQVIQTQPSADPRVQMAINESGSLFWRVTAFDEENFLIPAAYSYPIFSEPDPLAPPKLRSPTAVEEDGASYHPPTSRRYAWDWLWSLFIPAAEGQSKSKTKTKKALPPVIFNWEALPGADHYVIEISSSPSFESPEIIAKTSTNFYAWTNFNKQVYYYRVAGGANSGRMGVFSLPEKVDLTIWPPPKSPKTQVAKNTARTKTSPAIELPAKVKPAKAPEPETPPPDLAVVVPPPMATTKPPPARPIRPVGVHRASAWWQGVYQSEHQEGQEQVTADLQGGSFAGLGFHLDMNLSQTQLLVVGDWQNITWKPKNKSTWPYQKDVSSTDWHLGLSLADEQSPWFYGGTLQQTTRLERVDLERLDGKAHFGFGPHFGWRQLEAADFKRQHSLHLVFADDFTQARSHNQWQYPLTSGFFVGGEFNLSFSFGDLKASSIQLGLQLGKNW